MLKVGPRRSTANFSSMLRPIPGIRERGGSRRSETKDVTTVVKAAAILCHVMSGDFKLPY